MFSFRKLKKNSRCRAGPTFLYYEHCAKSVISVLYIEMDGMKGEEGEIKGRERGRILSDDNHPKH
jgi:hypothetical protein